MSSPGRPKGEYRSAQHEGTPVNEAAHRHPMPPAAAAVRARGGAGFQREMAAGMATMMRDMHAAGASGDPDADFLAMMIPHHAGAIEMARLVLLHGRDPTTRQLAEEIIASQTIEIEGMTRRLAALTRPRRGGRAAEDYPALGGTRGP